MCRVYQRLSHQCVAMGQQQQVWGAFGCVAWRWACQQRACAAAVPGAMECPLISFIQQRQLPCTVCARSWHTHNQEHSPPVPPTPCLCGDLAQRVGGWHGLCQLTSVPVHQITIHRSTWAARSCAGRYSCCMPVCCRFAWERLTIALIAAPKTVLCVCNHCTSLNRCSFKQRATFSENAGASPSRLEGTRQ